MSCFKKCFLETFAELKKIMSLADFIFCIGLCASVLGMVWGWTVFVSSLHLIPDSALQIFTNLFVIVPMVLLVAFSVIFKEKMKACNTGSQS